MNNHRTPRLLLLMLVAAVLTAFAAPSAQARSQSRDKDVVLLQGFDILSDHDCAIWNPLIAEMNQRDGASTRVFHKVTYYKTAANMKTSCYESVDGWSRTGSPAGEHFGSHDAAGNHNTDTRLEHLGYHLAWYLYKRYSQYGKTVDVVAHSMGGLVLRYAMTRVAEGDPVFPPKLLIEDAVTVATPHGGTTGITTPLLCPGFVQCTQMKPGSAFLATLGAHPNPNPSEATDWTALGSEVDDTVEGTSAIAMTQANQRVLYSPVMLYLHGGIYSDTSTTADATLRFSLTPGQALANFAIARPAIPFIQTGLNTARAQRGGVWIDNATAMSGW